MTCTVFQGLLEAEWQEPVLERMRVKVMFNRGSSNQMRNVSVWSLANILALSMVALATGCASNTSSPYAAPTTVVTSNALDRINFGDTGTDAYSESAHSLVNMSNPTGTDSLGLTWREIAPSLTAASYYDPTQNRVLTFTVVCDPSKQNYLTIQIWGGGNSTWGLNKTTNGATTNNGNVIYLETTSQGTDVGNYYSTNLPEFDFQVPYKDSLYQPGFLFDEEYPNRYVYETLPIPLSMTEGKTSVTLTLNAAQSYGYYSGGTANLGCGLPLNSSLNLANCSTSPSSFVQTTSRPIFAAFSHTDPYLRLSSSDVETGAAPAASAPTPTAYNTTYFSGLASTMVQAVQGEYGFESYQAYGPIWTAAVNNNVVPAKVYGIFFGYGTTPSSASGSTAWLNNAAIGTSGGNNVIMERLDMLAYLYTHNMKYTYTPTGLLYGGNAAFYQSADVVNRIIAALDGYSYMQSLNGSWGDMTAWDGIGATTATASNPYGRANAQGSPIEGNGTWALGSAIVQLENDATFLAALDQPINPTLEPGVTRAQAYASMLLNHLNFLDTAHGHAPNQDQLQARAYIFTNLALQFLDSRYGTSNAISNSAVLSYVDTSFGLAEDQYGGVYVSPYGLSLELNGTGNGSYDGGYGEGGMRMMMRNAYFLSAYGIESSTVHPCLDRALLGVHSFSNFIYPSVISYAAFNSYYNYSFSSGSSLQQSSYLPGYQTTYRKEENLTFRKNYSISELDTGSEYYSAAVFNDPYAIHAFYLEQAAGLSWNFPPVSDAHFDDTVDDYIRSFGYYQTLAEMANSQSDPSGVTFLQESNHADGVFADPEASTVVIKNKGEVLSIVLNWRPLQIPGQDNKPSGSDEIVNNLARIHDSIASYDRIATIAMPYNSATGASGSYTSGIFGTLYIVRYGQYLVALNWQPSTATLTLPVDMNSGTTKDLVSGTNYNLAGTTSVSVPANGAVVLYTASMTP